MILTIQLKMRLILGIRLDFRIKLETGFQFEFVNEMKCELHFTVEKNSLTTKMCLIAMGHHT